MNSASFGITFSMTDSSQKATGLSRLFKGRRPGPEKLVITQDSFPDPFKTDHKSQFAQALSENRALTQLPIQIHSIVIQSCQNLNAGRAIGMRRKARSLDGQASRNLMTFFCSHVIGIL